jgi:hypothetical protein
MKPFRFEGFLRLFNLVFGKRRCLCGGGFPLAVQLAGRGHGGPHSEHADDKGNDESVHGCSSWGADVD